MANSEVDQHIILKQTLVENLAATLSFNPQERVIAEEQIKILEVNDSFGICLTEIIIDASIPPEIRQLSSVLLKQYVNSHWSSLSEEKFKPPEVSQQAKGFIRSNLPNGLKDDSSKIRSSVAYAMSRIASFDWPDAWPELFTLLIEALHSMNPNVIHGGMRVFAEFAGEVTDLQIPHIAPVLLPEMLKIMQNPTIYGIRTSGRAINIFATIAGLIGLMKGYYKGVDKQHLFPHLPEFLRACSTQLCAPDGPTSDCGMKMEILKALEILIKNFPKTLSTYINDILPPVWSIFTQSVEHYINTTVNCCDHPAEAVDEDGEVLSFENLVFSVFQFIQGLVETPKFKKTVDQHLEEILYYTMEYMQITENQAELWSSDPNQFVEDEDEETFSYSVRISAQEIILTLAERFKSAIQKLCNAANRLKIKGDERKALGDTNWWKYHEVCLLCLGYVQPNVCEKLETGEINESFAVFLRELLLFSCTAKDLSPFLIGQSFWCSSRYSKFLDDGTLGQFLVTTVSALQQGQDAVLRVFAVKSLFGFCEYLKDNDKVSLLHPHLEAIMSGLISMATSYSDSVLAITLDTLLITVKVNSDVTTLAVQKGSLLSLINVLFLKHATDHHLYPLIEDMYARLCEIPSCSQLNSAEEHVAYAVMQLAEAGRRKEIPPLTKTNIFVKFSVLEKTAPTLASILESTPDKVPFPIIPPTIDVITVILRHGPKPANEGFVNRMFPLVVRRTLESDDDALMQNGGECVRAFIACSENLLLWQDGGGQNGLSWVVQTICKLLDPQTSESTSLYVGKLIHTLVQKISRSVLLFSLLTLNKVNPRVMLLQEAIYKEAGNSLGENLEVILRAVLSKLQKCQIFTVTQSLLMVFIQLLRYQIEWTLDFLSAVPSPTGKAALDYIMNEWCSKQSSFYGKYDVKASCDAMCKLLSFAIATGDKRFTEIIVLGDEIPCKGIVTRSQAKNGKRQFTEVPLAVKLFKLLVNELSNQIETSGQNESDESDDDEDDDEWEDIDEGENEAHLKNSIQSTIESLFSPSEDFRGFDGFDDLDDDEENEDPDTTSDPINEIDVKEYLTQYVREFSQQACFMNFVASLNDAEKNCLGKIGLAS